MTTIPFLPDRLNREPVVWRGLTTRELFLALINDFVRAVIHKAPYPVTAVDGLAVSWICEAVHQSLESQKPVSLK